jgi:hypothetical protein
VRFEGKEIQEHIREVCSEYLTEAEVSMRIDGSGNMDPPKHISGHIVWK